MGSGKSTLGRRAATRMAFNFLDLDEEIEKRESRKIPDIFRENGEAYFREVEAALLREVGSIDGDTIIACGGGTPCFADNMDYMNNVGITVYLKLSPEAICSRLESAKTVRPLIKDKKGDVLLDYVRTALDKREQYYTISQFTINGLGASPGDIEVLLNEK